MMISTDALAYWYFRLNGYLTIVNFLVHPETRRDFSTEVDILGVRFPYRSENFRRPMLDDKPFRAQPLQPHIAIVEVKSGLCELNGPWTDPKRKNFHKVIAAIGAFPIEHIDTVAQALHSDGAYSDEGNSISLICVGAQANRSLRKQYPDVPQILYEQILSFIHRRFRRYRAEKAQHNQWDQNGKNLWDCVMAHDKPAEFINRVSVQPPGDSSVRA